MAEALAPGIRETSRDYHNPYRPFPLSIVNAVGRIVESAGFSRPMAVEPIIRAAGKAAGLPSGYLGEDQSYREGLDVLVDSVESESRLNPIGKMITRSRLTGILRARFQAERLLIMRPDILSARLAPPVIITGLQRTGTTLLHRLLAADRRFRSLSSWEVLDPSPPPASRRGEDPRLKAARRAEKGAAWMAPDFFAVHPIDHQAPEEDVLLLDNSFHSTVAEAILRVPSYAAWLESVDSTPAYEFMRKLLLLFQAEDTRPRWVLKTPHHLEYLDILLKVFPEAKVIQTHRDPAQTTGSFLSMVGHGYGMFSDSPDTMEIGRHWNRKCRRMVEKGMAYRRSLSPETEAGTFMDIRFSDLITDPVAVLKRIYGFIGLEFDNIAEEEARGFLNSNGRHRFGRHVYRLSDFGLCTDEIRADYSDYRTVYAIPDEE